MRYLGLGGLLLAALSTPANAEWRKAVSPSFTIYADLKEAQLIEYTRKIERFDTLLRRRFNIQAVNPPARLTVYVVGPNTPASSLSGAIFGGRKDNWLKGFYTTGPNGPVAVMQRMTGEGQFSLDSETLMFHEYAHHFMWQYFQAAYPAWFVEGFAEFNSTTEFDKEGKASYGRPAHHRAADLLVTKPLPIEQLLTAKISDLTNDQKSSLYGRGWLLTHYLNFSEERSGQLNSYIRAVNSGTEGLTAAKAAFGDLQQLNKDLDAYLKRNSISYVSQSVATPVSDAITISLVEAGEAATMLDQIKVRRRTNSEERPTIIASLEKALAKYPNNAAILALLAQLHHEQEDDKQSIKFAALALTANPNHAKALLYKGMSEMRELIRDDVTDPARWKVARASIAKANRLDPEDPYPLLQYYKSFRMQGVDASPVAGDGLAKAFSLTPQDHDIRFTYITHLIGKDQLADAAALAKPVAYDPHGGSSAAYARNLIARLERAIKKGGRAQDFYADNESEAEAASAP